MASRCVVAIDKKLDSKLVSISANLLSFIIACNLLMPRSGLCLLRLSRLIGHGLLSSWLGLLILAKKQGMSDCPDFNRSTGFVECCWLINYFFAGLWLALLQSHLFDGHMSDEGMGGYIKEFSELRHSHEGFLLTGYRFKLHPSGRVVEPQHIDVFGSDDKPLVRLFKFRLWEGV